MMKKEAEKVTSKGVRKRTWVRLDCQGVLHGSINFIFTLEEQAVFLKMIAMAATYGVEPGIISDNEGKPLPRDFVAYELHCPPDVLESVLKKGIAENSIKDNSNGIELVNFKKYQFTEYDRQKPYRELSKKAQLEQKQERQRLGLCELCGEEGHDKYTCPHSKYGHLIQR